METDSLWPFVPGLLRPACRLQVDSCCSLCPRFIPSRGWTACVIGDILFSRWLMSAFLKSDIFSISNTALSSWEGQGTVAEDASSRQGSF